MRKETWQFARYFVVVAVLWVNSSMGGASVAASGTWFLCENVCSASTACEETCYENMMEFENGNDISCLQWGVYDEEAMCCGDGVCEMTEGDYGEWGYCGLDCGAAPGSGSCPSGPTCNAAAQSGCSTGQLCAPDNCCVSDQGWPGTPPSPPACFVAFCSAQNSCCPGWTCLMDHENWQGGICYPSS